MYIYIHTFDQNIIYYVIIKINLDEKLDIDEICIRLAHAKKILLTVSVLANRKKTPRLVQTKAYEQIGPTVFEWFPV